MPRKRSFIKRNAFPITLVLGVLVGGIWYWKNLNKPQPFLGGIYPAPPEGSIPPTAAQMQGSDALIASPSSTLRIL